jgi:hypothetical protein
MTAAEMLLELRDGQGESASGIGLGVEGGIMQRSGVKVRGVRVLIYCRKSL